MKYLNLALGLVGLGLLGGPACFAHNGIGHATFKTEKHETTITARDGTNGAVKAVWTSGEETVDGKQAWVYTLKLTRDPNSKDSANPFSLYNLRLQGRLWSVKVISSKGVEFVRFDEWSDSFQPIGAKGVANTKPLIPRAAPPSHSKGKSPGASEKNVLFLRYTSVSDATCEVKVVSNRPARGKPSHHRSKTFVDHDLTPPPPEPGGEEGEEEEGGGDEGEGGGQTLTTTKSAPVVSPAPKKK